VIDVALLAGRVLLLALLYLFLFAAVRAGLGLVRRGAPGAPEIPLSLVVMSGPPELSGVRVALDHTVRIGRSPDLELVIADDFVSTAHARIIPSPTGPALEDLESTNGTLLNGRRVNGLASLAVGDEIEVGTVKLKVARS
jgi:pSer/pThr/pTyr-binding forkhead associated (FHA) protein